MNVIQDMFIRLTIFMITIISIACIIGCAVVIFFGLKVLKDTKEIKPENDNDDEDEAGFHR
jgi:hypothetical protein